DAPDCAPERPPRACPGERTPGADRLQPRRMGQRQRPHRSGGRLRPLTLDFARGPLHPRGHSTTVPPARLPGPVLSFEPGKVKESEMPHGSLVPVAHVSRVTRRDFLRHAGWSGVGATAIVLGGRRGAFAQAGSPIPDWIPASTKPPKSGGTLTRAS